MGSDQIEKLNEFWLIVVDVWNNGYLGVDFGRILVALGIFLAFLVIRKIFTRVVLSRVKTFVESTKNNVDRRLVEALEKPVRFIPIVLGVFFALDYLNLQGTFATLEENFVRSLIVLNIFWVFHRMIDPLSQIITHLERVFSDALIEWLVKAIKILVAFVGIATVLEIWGIEVLPILAGMGLIGVAVALGAQDLFKNLIAGILILAEKRFENGDWIRVEGLVEGTVEKIGFRSTFIRRFDLAPVHVPNAQLSDSPVANFTRMPHRRIYWLIGVEYKTTVDQLKTIRDEIDAYIKDKEFLQADETSTFVRVDSFNASSIDIMLYCFTRTRNWGEYLEIKERLAYRIKEIVEGAGTGFAFPSQSIYVESLPDGSDKPDVYTPPSATNAQTTKSVPNDSGDGAAPDGEGS